MVRFKRRGEDSTEVQAERGFSQPSSYPRRLTLSYLSVNNLSPHESLFPKLFFSRRERWRAWLALALMILPWEEKKRRKLSPTAGDI